MSSVRSAVCWIPTLEAKAKTFPTLGIDVDKVSQASQNYNQKDYNFVL